MENSILHGSKIAFALLLGEFIIGGLGMTENICKPKNTVLHLTAISVRYTASGELSVITEGVKIGEGCVIGANSVVTQNIPPYSVAVGAPAHVVRKRANK